MIVWITHAKVGHRQTPYKQKSPTICWAFLFGVALVRLALLVYDANGDSPAEGFPSCLMPRSAADIQVVAGALNQRFVWQCAVELEAFGSDFKFILRGAI